MAFEIDPLIDVEKFTEEVSEDISDLTAAMRTQTARAAFYGILLAKARRQAQRIETAVKVTEAHLTKAHREVLTKEALELANVEGGKPERITTDMVKAAVMTDPRMLKAMAAEAEASEIRSICQIAHDSFRHRRDMLVSLGHISTAEMKSLGSQTVSGGDALEQYKKRRAARSASQNGE